MRLLKLIVIAFVFGGLAWIAKQSVRVESNDLEVQITIDRNALREAGARFKRQSKHAVSTVGQALEDAGETEEPAEPPRPTVIDKLFSR